PKPQENSRIELPPPAGGRFKNRSASRMFAKPPRIRGGRKIRPRRLLSGARGAPGRPKRSPACSGQELSGTIAQHLNLEHEIHHTVSKLCILALEPLKQSLIAPFGDMSIRSASWLPSMLAGHLQAHHIFYPV